MVFTNPTSLSSTVFQGYCPDPYCNERLIIDDSKDSYIDCYFCGQTFRNHELQCVSSITTIESKNLRTRISRMPKRKGVEWIRVYGMSPFYCKLISPMFTLYGINNDGDVVRWSDLPVGQFNCKNLAEYAFEIEESKLITRGYGLDATGSLLYLSETLSNIARQNNDVKVLVPLHVSGDGSCLVHALSRALVGREIYWHVLRKTLKQDLISNEEWYKKMLGDFVADDDWKEIINECDTNYVPRDDHLGLRTAHIFALANILHRPIILLDNPNNMAIGADFSAVFLPVLRKLEDCKGDNGELHKPLVIAWANKAHSHFVPLVTIKGRSKAKLSRSFIPKAWCTDDEKVEQYISFENGHCIVSSGRNISMLELHKLINLMHRKCTELNKLSPSLLCDYYEDIYNKSTFSSLETRQGLADCLKLCEQYKLWRCMICWRLNKTAHLKKQLLSPGGFIYCTLTEKYKVPLIHNYRCTIEPLGIFRYDITSNSFEPEIIYLRRCKFCNYSMNQMRLQFPLGNLMYMDGDHSHNPAPDAFCQRKMKHIFNNNLEYDNPPFKGEIEIKYNGKNVTKTFYWFMLESDATRNSDFDKVTKDLIEKNFPSETSSQKFYDYVYQLIVDKVNSFVWNGDSICRDPCWLLTDEDLIPQSRSPKVMDDCPSVEEYNENQTVKTPSIPYLILKLANNLNNSTRIFWDEYFTYGNLIQEICETYGIGEEQIKELRLDGQSTPLLESDFPIKLGSVIIVDTEPYDWFEHVRECVADDSTKTACSFDTKCAIEVLHEKIGTSNFWSYAKQNPELFTSDGLLYQLILEEASLSDNQHYTLPAFSTNHLFTYVSANDRLELCIPRIGHFEINADTESEILTNLKNNSDVIKQLETSPQIKDTPVTTVIAYTLPDDNCC